MQTTEPVFDKMLQGMCFTRPSKAEQRERFRVLDATQLNDEGGSGVIDILEFIGAIFLLSRDLYAKKVRVWLRFFDFHYK